MRSAVIIEVEIAADRMPCVTDAVIGPQIDLLVFDAAPQPLDKNIISPSPFAVHTDRDVVSGEHAGEGRTDRTRPD